MLTQKLEFEIEYEPVTKTLLLIDYSPPKQQKPVKLVFNNVKDIDGLKTVIEAWTTLKEEQAKKDLQN